MTILGSKSLTALDKENVFTCRWWLWWGWEKNGNVHANEKKVNLNANNRNDNVHTANRKDNLHSNTKNGNVQSTNKHGITA